jgi:hypothetical protein
MKLNRKLIAVPAIALAAGLGLAACGSQAAPASHATTPAASQAAAVANPVSILNRIHGATGPAGQVNGTSGIIGTDTREANGMFPNGGTLRVYTGSSTADVVQAVAAPTYPQDGSVVITGPSFLIEYWAGQQSDGSYQWAPTAQAVATETGGTVTVR